MQVKGIDTIVDLVGEPPPEIPVDRGLVKKQTILSWEWNTKYIAMVPYCYRDREPLVWSIPPDGKKIFTCGKCGRVWVVEK
jgi:hypothetical protein